MTARALSEVSCLPIATVSKILKTLTRHELLNSTRGASGGYSLALAPNQISVANIVEAMEGPLAITECSDNRVTDCDDGGSCPMRSHWNHINIAVKGALQGVTLEDLQRPTPFYNIFNDSPRVASEQQPDV